MVKESQKQPTVTLKISTNSVDYQHLNLSCPRIKATKVNAITDTGAQSSLMGLKTFRKCGFIDSCLLPVKKRMYAANSENINILGAVFVRLSGRDACGNVLETAEMIYVSNSTDLFYLSRHAMEQLKIISPEFPVIGAAASLSDATPDVPSTNHSAAKSMHVTHKLSYDESCSCPKRLPPPQRPERLPFKPVAENIPEMKRWLLDRYAASTFNKCPHRPLPMMSGPPIKIHVDPDAKPSAVHTPASIPIRWRETIKQQLDADVALGVIEKV